MLRSASGLLVVLIIFLSTLTFAQTYFIKFRSSYHPDFLRIVLEGDKEIIQIARVYQRGDKVVVAFPEKSFTIITEKTVIPFKREGMDRIIFSSGQYRGLSVFTLHDPERLVIDVYPRDKKPDVFFYRKKPEVKFKTKRLKTLVIDPGHGGYEYGVRGEQYSEKNISLDIARKLSALMAGRGVDVYLTRKIDMFLSMNERIELTNTKTPDSFVSIHVGNHADVVVYVPRLMNNPPRDIDEHLWNRGQRAYINMSHQLAEAMREAFASEFGEDMVRIKSLPYSMLSKIESPAVLIELPSFENAEYNDDLRTEFVRTMYKGFYIYEEIRTE